MEPTHPTHPQKENTMSSESEFDPSKPLFKWWKATVSKDYADHDTPHPNMTDQPSAPSIEPSVDALRKWLARGEYSYPTSDAAQALAAYDLMSQRAERLEVALGDLVKSWETGRGRVMTNFPHVPDALRACDWIQISMDNALTHARTVLSENKEEKL